MRIGRYSDTGFEPVLQTHLIAQHRFLTTFDESTVGLSGHALNIVKLGVESRLRNFDSDFSFVGIHVFFIPTKEKDIRFFLNHLDKNPSYHEMVIDDDVLSMSLDDPFCQTPVPLRTSVNIFFLNL